MRLGGEDAAWLHMEDPTNPMVVNSLLELDAHITIPQAFALVERLTRIARFRERVIEPASPVGVPHWEPDPHFDLKHHIEHVVLEEAETNAFVSRAVSSLLDRRRPLWRAYVIDQPGKGTTLLYRIHHAIADGFALLDVLLAATDRDETNGTRVVHEHRVGWAKGARRYVEALRQLIAIAPDPTTPLKQPLGAEKRVAYTIPFALADVKALAHSIGATVNDVLVAVAAGALRRYLMGRGVDPEGLELHAMVPVNLRSSGASQLGNQFGLFVLPLPVGVEGALDRLSVVKHRMDRRKATPEAAVSHDLLRMMGWLPRAVENVGVEFFARKASLVLTNVAGPRERVKLAGVPVKRITFWVPQSGHLGLGISIFSYAGEVTMGVMADARLVPDPETLAANLHTELAELEVSVRAREAQTQESWSERESSLADSSRT